MSRIPLEPEGIELDGSVFNAIKAWPWSLDEEFVSIILAADIPQRVMYQSGQIWVYRDPQKRIVGFGTLSLCRDYHEFTNNQPHTYIPLLGVSPANRGAGHGTSIVKHLIDEATCLLGEYPDICEDLFLDVYEDSAGAIKLYRKCGFVDLVDRIDPANGKKFYVMAKRLNRCADSGPHVRPN